MRARLALLAALLLACKPLSPDTTSNALPAAALPAARTPAALASATPEPRPALLTARQSRLVEGARSTVGDLYDAGYYAGGPPPEGRGACTDVVYAALKRDGLDLQAAMEKDIAARPDGYPSLRDANIDYRWAPNQIVWFRRHMKALPLDSDFEPGDVVYWSLLDDGVADHCGIVSDRMEGDQRLVIHNFPPACREDAALRSWVLVGHFRRL